MLTRKTERTGHFDRKTVSGDSADNGALEVLDEGVVLEKNHKANHLGQEDYCSDRSS